MNKFGKFVALSAALVGTMCLTGCFSLESTHSYTQNEDVVFARNYGWQLFNCVPLLCGNATKDAFCPWAFFRDDVTTDKIQARVTEEIAHKGRTASDLTYHNYESVMLEIPMTGIVLPIPYLICYHEVQLSGVAK